ASSSTSVRPANSRSAGSWTCSGAERWTKPSPDGARVPRARAASQSAAVTRCSRWSTGPACRSRSAGGAAPPDGGGGCPNGRAPGAFLVRGSCTHLPSDHRPTRGGPVEQTEPVEDVVEETLVEEVSIDGMCGVY